MSGLNVAWCAWIRGRRSLCRASLAILAALVAWPCDGQETPPRNGVHDLQSIVDAKVLRVAVTRFDLPAFHVHRRDGTLAGAEIDLAEQIGRALGVKVEFIDDADSFDAVVDLVATARADIGVSKLSQTYRRLHSVRF